MPRRWSPDTATTTRYVYFAHDGAPTKRIKIGMSYRLRERLRILGCELIFAVPCEWYFAHTLEQTLHAQFAHLRLPATVREGGTEWFAVNEDISDLIRFVRLKGFWPWDLTLVVL